MKALGKGSIASIVQIGLQVTWVLLWILAACLALATGAYLVILGLTFAGVIDPSVLAHGGQVRVDGGSVVVSGESGLPGVTWPVAVPALLIGCVAITGALVIVWRLRKLFDSFSSGEPFRRENAQHLRVIWITMLIIELSRYALMALTGALIGAFGGPHVDADFALTIDFSTWGSILILIVLAEVFREGARMKEEQELTI